MSEREDVEIFSRDLEDLVAGRAAAARSGAPELETARRLLAADFSAGRRVRAGLRARLLAKRDGARRRLLAPALAAACLLLASAPFLPRFFRGAGPSSVAVRAPLRPAAVATAPVDTRASAAARKTSYPRGELGLPVLPGRFDPETAAVPAAARVFASAAGREVAFNGGRAVVWELEGDSYRLESRRTSPEEIFKRPHFGGVL